MAKVRGARGRFTSNIVCGRKHCTRCRRWRSILDFGVHRWADAEKTVPKYLHSVCKPCKVKAERVRLRRPDVRLARAEYEREWKYDRRRQRGVPQMPEAEYVTRYGVPRNIDGTESRVPIEAFRPCWDAILRAARARFRTQETMDVAQGGGRGSRTGAFDAAAFQVWAGLNDLEYALIKKAMSPSGWKTHPSLPLALVDRVMTAAGMEHLVAQLYVVNTPTKRQRSSRSS